MNKKINVLSLFDGISCGRIALDRANINVGKYYASEIDKYATQISEHNYPDIIRLGDVTKWKEWDIDFSRIDLLIAGFPCQAWSVAGRQKGDTDPRGALVHDLIAIWNECKKHNPDIKFLFENVKMKKEFIEYINGLFGVEPIEINSALVSAQNRRRLYWTNIEGIEQPEDKGILLKYIIECCSVNNSYYANQELQKGDKSNGQLNPNYKSQANTIHDLDGKSGVICAGTHGYANGHIKQEFDKTESLKSYFEKHRRQLVFELKQINDRVEGVTIDDDGIRPHRGDTRKSGISELGRINFEDAEKTYCVTANHSPKILCGAIRGRYIENKATIVGRRLNDNGHREDYNKDVKTTQCLEVRKTNTDKSNCLTTVEKDNVLSSLPAGRYPDVYNKLTENLHYRKLTPLECERLQTLPDSYTLVMENDKQKVSNSQRYKSIGNGWTVDVISHIFKNLKF